MPLLEDKEKRQAIRKKLYEGLSCEGVEISKTIKMLRKTVGRDQPDFAAWVGISLSALRRLEQGHEHFQAQTLLKILKKFRLKLVVK